MDPKFRFVEFVQGGLQNRNKIFETSAVRLNGQVQECYRSMFVFDEGLAAWVNATGSVKGYTGPHAAEMVVLDFDGADLEAVRLEVVNFLKSLKVNFAVPVESVRVAFSGAKGWHVVLPSVLFGGLRPSTDLAERVRYLVDDLASGLKSLDRSIYQPGRLIRMLNSINGKSGLFKVPITNEELQSRTADDIKRLAVSPRKVETLALAELAPVPALVDLRRKWEQADLRKIRPAYMTQESLFAPVAEGVRNTAATRIAGRLIGWGVPLGGGLELMAYWNRQNTPPLQDDELETLVRRAYRQWGKPETEKHVLDLPAMEAEYMQDVVNVREEDKVRLGFPTLDSKIRVFLPGETLFIVAKSGNAKTALLHEVLLNFAHETKRPALMFSLEMPASGIFERTMQKTLNGSGYDVERSYRQPSEDFTRKKGLVFSQYQRFFCVPDASLSLEEIEEYISYAEEVAYPEQKTGLVGIDYLSLLTGREKDVFEQTAHNARGIKAIAKKLRVPIICLVQTTKANDQYTELNENSGRDSGAIFEAADYFLTMWRNGEKQQTDPESILFTASLQKNRKGGHVKVNIMMRRDTLAMVESDKDERQPT